MKYQVIVHGLTKDQAEYIKQSVKNNKVDIKVDQ